jgi:nicotinamide-nucleotide amidase
MALKGEQTVVEKLNLGGTREANRIRTIKYGCHFLLKKLQKSQNA